MALGIEKCSWMHFKVFLNTSKMVALRSTLALMLVLWSLVGTACMNFVKTSVITNTLSLPSLAGCNNVKSIARTSRGLVVRKCPMLGKVHFSHCFILMLLHHWAFLASSNSLLSDTMFALLLGGPYYHGNLWACSVRLWERINCLLWP